jgi:hypothetical protein
VSKRSDGAALALHMSWYSVGLTEVHILSVGELECLFLKLTERTFFVAY